MLTRRQILASLSVLPCAAAPAGVAGGKARLKTAICAYSFRKALGSGKLSYLDLVDMAVENQVDGLDATVYWFPQDGLNGFLRELRRKAYLSAVEIPSIAIRTNLCRPDERDQEREVAWLNHWVDVADRLGASHIRVFGGNVPDGRSEDEAAGWVTEILKRAADYAASRGVILGLENHGGITLYAKRIVEIVRAVDHPYVGINLDTGNFHTKPYEQIEMCLPYAVNSQFKVNVRYEDGHTEKSDWDRVVGMFSKAGYRGYLALEYEAEEDPSTAVPRHLATIRRLVHKHQSA